MQALFHLNAIDFHNNKLISLQQLEAIDGINIPNLDELMRPKLWNTIQFLVTPFQLCYP